LTADSQIEAEPLPFLQANDFITNVDLPFTTPSQAAAEDSNGLHNEIGAMKNHESVCDCFLQNHNWLNRINNVTKQPEITSLDGILQSLVDVSAHITRYLGCKTCDNGCPRLFNLAMLHQRIVSLLCAITKNPASYLHNSAGTTVHITLGTYRFSELEDLEHKRLVILSAVRRIDLLVTGFDSMIRSEHGTETEIGHQEGMSNMTESGKINLLWLLNINRNLKSRLKVIVSILDQSDWVLSTTKDET
jgi:hypothetical protein